MCSLPQLHSTRASSHSEPSTCKTSGLHLCKPINHNWYEERKAGRDDERRKERWSKGEKEERKDTRREGSKEARKEGRKEARKQGRKKGRREARKEGRKEGRKEARKEARKQGRKEERKEGSKEGSKEGRKQGGKEGSKKGREGGREIVKVTVGCNERRKELTTLSYNETKVKTPRRNCTTNFRYRLKLLNNSHREATISDNNIGQWLPFSPIPPAQCCFAGSKKIERKVDIIGATLKEGKRGRAFFWGCPETFDWDCIPYIC